MSIVMSFSSDIAFGHLKSEGYVFTFRENRRAEPNGEVWINRGRGTTGIFYGETREVEKDVSPESSALERYAPESGFGRVDEWREAIAGLNGGLPETGYIYRVDKGEPMNDE